MKRIFMFILLVLMSGCRAELTAHVQEKTQSIPAPCAPSTGLTHTGEVPATITTRKIEQDESWSSTHKVECPENMRTVMPSQREYDKASTIFDGVDKLDEWFGEHTYCIKDGMK